MPTAYTLPLSPQQAALLCMALAAYISDPYPYRYYDDYEMDAYTLRKILWQQFGHDRSFTDMLASNAWQRITHLVAPFTPYGEIDKCPHRNVWDAHDALRRLREIETRLSKLEHK